MVLLLGNSPQQILHDVFSDHTDITTGCSHSKENGCYHSDYKFCGNETVYIGSDYNLFADSFSPFTSCLHTIRQTELTDYIPEACKHQPENKGPPSLV
jgi:hypothetical protein